MNAPLPEHIRKALETVTLDDKYSLEYGRAFMSGIQALVKLPMLQRQRDQLAGKNTAGFVSGYRGSPLGGYDQALWAAKKYLQAQNIVFQPGVNEELAATALWGTQQLGFAPPGSNKFDGVFGIWYGKGPGVDRTADVFKHANMAGTTPWGGVIAVAGDDHVAKSSTAAHQSDHIFKACGLPVFFPSTVQEILDLGLHAFAMSRYAGVWAGMKTIQEIVESSATALIDPERVRIALPTDFEMPPGGVHIRWPDAALPQEERLFNTKWYAALAYVRANRLNYNVIAGPDDRFGIIASGKAFNDTRQALLDLGLDDATCRQLGIRLHKVNVVWPLEAQITRQFATGLREILVVEEKRQVIEYQLKEELYNWRADVRPNVLGKYHEGDESDHTGGEWSRGNPTANVLLRANADLSPALIARAIAQRLKKLGIDSGMQARIDRQLAVLDATDRAMQSLHVSGSGADRMPWFCSGCPHNTSTRVPEGSRAMAGIGCHFMSIWMDRDTVGFTQMGGEGVPWVGQQPFSHEKHVFANLGDGTYYHSGTLAVRQAIAAGADITYKILYNDAVAMTGGQPIGERPDGLSVIQIAQNMRAEGAAKITIVTDEPEKYDQARKEGLPDGIEIHHRDRLDAVQRAFREIKGTTVIIYDQTCATEKRRRRKRGTMADPAVRVLINDLVCEGCGDCSVQSNCLSVEPLETEFGRKRTINQSSCNKDMSCLKGFCPSFITVEGGQLRKKAKARSGVSPFELGALPEPALPTPEAGGAWGIVVAGVGGTGVITIGQLLGVAAHMEGKGIVTQDAAGLAQKGGATWSHVLIGATQDDIRTTRVSMAAADLVIGCDPIVAANKETVLRMREGRTHVALNSHGTPTAAFVTDGGWQNPAERCAADIARAVGPRGLASFDADAVAGRLMGDTLYVNPMLLGYAWQKGWVPLARESLLRAMELNNVQVDNNKAAFEWGRQAAHDFSRVENALKGALAGSGGAQVIEFRKRETLDMLISRRVEFLTAYQNAAYAQQYKTFVEQVQQAESRLGRTSLSEAVARYLFKLMAYKDEYEVARLHSDPAFLARIGAQFEGEYKLNYHLAPPLAAKRNEKGELVKKKYGPGMLTAFRWLARLKGLRGGPLDFFGRTEERRAERALIQQYRASLEEVLKSLSADNHAAAVEVARIPEQIKGYGHVKERNLKAARERWEALMAQWRQPGGAPVVRQAA
ncbi:indolepyruvate ferredoxin oxidoreductase family protein [Ottowia sp.]|jgi:indolepyruvate ferredoxin oxidoreductase|uniref:indolepyruvate ferredoxin oxidoreductase family protein n=1 Tax=Ottowia sp. TaxID=1898956 RepID=UPI0025E336A6|nr:indolepyruvate ferredoxin oxidoreductase family protein [Ottowia sp.]MBK6615077.1 indolepyruvate ferredoxin oxidoreductase family protein [Ottowia sp.]